MKTRKDFESAALIVRSLPMAERKGKALKYAREFTKDNPKFDATHFFASCIVSIPVSHINEYLKSKDIEIDLREVEFTIYYRWNDCDVDAALVPHFSNCCGRVVHEIGKSDMLGGGYETGPAHKTPIAGTVLALHDWARMYKWPKGVKACGGYNFVQGYSDMIFTYDGPVNKLQEVIEECKHILAKMIEKHVKYHGQGDKVQNRMVNVYRGTGSGIMRVE